MGDTHSFSVDVAKEVGVNAAILLQSIRFWCAKNRANGKHEHEGLYWTYNSVKAWHELYPYLGKSAIDSALKRLEDRGFIKVGKFNKSPYDQTKWYAITEKGLEFFDDSISENQEIKDEKKGNRSGKNQKPIPDTNQLLTDTKEDTMGQKPKKAKRFQAPTIEDVISYVKERGYHFDPQYFYDYYSSADWHLQNGKKITYWRRCCATWENGWKRRHARETELKGTFDEFSFKNKTGAQTTMDFREDGSYDDEITF